jgi:hypothetical protein
MFILFTTAHKNVALAARGWLQYLNPSMGRGLGSCVVRHDVETILIENLKIRKPKITFAS